uniref:Uncharacterized protein n=1 Tax=Tetranychus urticae TaxID=32264 RepID=T1KUM5_TETUR
MFLSVFTVLSTSTIYHVNMKYHIKSNCLTSILA